MHSGPKPTPWQERFWRHVEVGPPDHCWLWRGMRHKQGYGKLATTGRGTIFAHRASYILHCGDVPAGMDVCHRCDVPGCVNPAHLFIGTHTDNMRDMARKGRTGVRVGTANNQCKLPWAAVCAIRGRAASGERYASLARDFNVSTAYVGELVRRESRRVA